VGGEGSRLPRPCGEAAPLTAGGGATSPHRRRPIGGVLGALAGRAAPRRADAGGGAQLSKVMLLGRPFGQLRHEVQAVSSGDFALMMCAARGSRNGW
jgi:hypothetical protein